MEDVKVNTARVDETRHRAVFSQEQIKQLVAEAVAKAAGVSLTSSNVFVEKFWLSSTSRGTGTEYSAECTVVVDHTRSSSLRPASADAVGHSLD